MKILSIYTFLGLTILCGGLSHAQMPPIDTDATFEGWDYQLIEQPTVIKGQFVDFDPDSLEMEFGRIIYNHLVEGEQVVHLFEVSDSGRFEIMFPLMRPQEIMITLPYHFGYIYAVPGKTTAFTFDVAKSKADFEKNKEGKFKIPAPMAFHGDLAEFHHHFNELIPLTRKTFHWTETKILRDSLDQLEFKAARLQGMERQMEAVKQYLVEHHCSENIALYIRNKIRYHAYNDLMRYRWLKNLDTDRSRIELTDAYREFLNEENLNNPHALLTEEYSNLMHELHMDMYTPMKINYREVYDLLQESGELEQEDGDKLMHLARLEDEGAQIPVDTIQKLRVMLFKKYDAFAALQKEMGYKSRIDNIRDKLPEGQVRDIVATRFFLATIQRNTTLTQKELKDARGLIFNADLEAYIHTANENLAALDQQELPGEVTVIEDLLPIGEQVLDELVKPYRGKIVYIDYWAPWCGPCISEMQHSGQVKAQLKEQDVVFLYLGVNTDKDAWERAIKKYDISGEHYLLDGREYNILSGEFNISGIPRYMLVDQSGRVVNDHAPRPSESMRLLDEITELQK